MKEGWTYKKLGEICRIERGGSPRPIKQFITDEPNGLNWIKIGDTDPQGKYIYGTKEKIKPEGLRKSRWVEEDDFLLSNSMSFGRPYILKTNGCIHDGWLVLRDYQQSLYIDFFYYLLISQNVQNQFKTKAQGSTVSNLNTDRVADVDIAFPSLSDQKRVVSRLDAAFSHIDELKANAEKQLSEARALFQKSLAKAMKPKEGWKEKKLIEITHEKCPISYGIVQQGNHIDGGVPVVRPVDMREKYITRENLKCTTQTISDSYKRTILRGDELLLSVRGTTGIISLATPELKGCNVNRGIVPLYFKDQFNKDFLYYEMVSPILQSVFAEKTTGSTLKQINIKDLRLIKLSIPPNSEQQRIVERLDALSAHIRKLEENQKKIISECDALKQALLRKVFE